MGKKLTIILNMMLLNLTGLISLYLKTTEVAMNTCQ